MQLPGYTSGVSLAPYTTFKVGGAAEYFAEAHSEAELASLIETARAAEQPVTILGGGSNVLVADAGVAGCVIKNSIERWDEQVDDTHVVLTVGAGNVFDDVVARTVERGWWGMENLSHIPGSVGATPIQNVGAYGVEVADCIHTVRAYHPGTRSYREFTPAECAFAYRDSFFKRESGRAWVVVAVSFALSTEAQPNVTYRDVALRFANTTTTQADMRQAIIDIRSQKFPDWHTVGTAGSFFKNPIITQAKYERLRGSYPELPGYPTGDGRVKVPLGWILEHVCQLRGTSKGGVGSYAGQALVVVQTGGATARAIHAFADDVAKQVQAATGIAIEWEVTPLGQE